MTSKEDLYAKINHSLQDLDNFNDIDSALSEIDKDNYPNEIIVLHEICILPLTIVNQNLPYFEITGNTIVDIATKNMHLLIECLDNLENPLIKGRIADILWLTKTDTKIDKPIQYAQKSIENFSKIALSSENYLDIINCYERALILSTQTKQNINKDYIISQLNEAVLSRHTLDTPFFQYAGAKVLLDYNLLIDFDQLTDKLITIGEKRCTELGIALRTIEYLELALESCSKAKNKEKEISLLQKIMQIYKDEADEQSQGSRARQFYEKALEVARKIPTSERDDNTTKTINDLETKIFEEGKIIMGQLFAITGPLIDITSLCTMSKQFMSNIDNHKDALIKFSQIDARQSYDSIKQLCIESNSQAVFSTLVPTTILSHDGRTTMTMPYFNKNDITVVEQYMTKNFNESLVNFLCNAYILPAFQQLSEDHQITLKDIKEICQLSSIVPNDRLELISKALYLGFQNDFQTSIYLLSPQVENIIRQILKANNTSTTHIDKNNNQTENGLSTLLDLPETKDILNEDTLFTLKALFTSQLGPNLRNNIAHGLFNDQESHSQEVIYAWWFIFQWIMNTQKNY